MISSDSLLFSPLIIFIFFVFVGLAFLIFGRFTSAKGRDSAGKRAHYACGEDLETPDLILDYHAFYRLALLFGIFHIVALVASTIPSGYSGRILPLIYLIGAVLSIIVLLEEGKK